MGIDIPSKNLLECTDVFADISNVNLFSGSEVVNAEQLEPIPTELKYKDNQGKHRHHYLDTRMNVLNEKTNIVILCAENQAGIDNTMPVRDMGYQYSNYNEQIKKLRQENEKQGIHLPIKGISNGQKLVPVISLILYYGKEEWSGPKSLFEMFDIPEEKKSLWEPLIVDHNIKVINLRKQDEETRKKYQSDFRHVVDYLATDGDIQKQREFFRDSNKKIKHPEEYLDMMETLTSEKKFREIKEVVLKNQIQRGDGLNMDSMYDLIEEDVILEKAKESMEKGRKEGIEKGRSDIIRNMLRKKHTPEVIHEMTDQPLDYIYQIKEKMAFVQEESSYGSEKEE